MSRRCTRPRSIGWPWIGRWPKRGCRCCGADRAALPVRYPRQCPAPLPDGPRRRAQDARQPDALPRSGAAVDAPVALDPGPRTRSRRGLPERPAGAHGAASCRVAIDVPPGLQAIDMPPMMLLTLVENAIKHGLNPQPTAARSSSPHTGKAIAFVWMSSMTDADSAPASGGGIGLTNVRARLRALHGDAASLTLVENVQRGVTSTLRLPARQRAEEVPT